MIDIPILGVATEAPSQASDTNWAAKQVALEQALAAGINTVSAEVDVLQAFAIVRRLSANVTPVGTTAATTEDNLMTYALPAATLDVNGKGIRVTAFGIGVNTADATTVRAYFGAALLVTKVLTASQVNAWRCVFEVLRTGAATQVTAATVENGGVAASTQTTINTAAETLSGAVTLKLTGQRAVSSVANSIQQLGMVVELIP